LVLAVVGDPCTSPAAASKSRYLVPFVKGLASGVKLLIHSETASRAEISRIFLVSTILRFQVFYTPHHSERQILSTGLGPEVQPYKSNNLSTLFPVRDRAWLGPDFCIKLSKKTSRGFNFEPLKQGLATFQPAQQ
jgi:hypothetical protein